MSMSHSQTNVIAATPASSRRVSSGRQSKRLFGLGVLLVVIVGAVATGAWAFIGWSEAATQLASVDKHVVSPVSFQSLIKVKGELNAAQSTDITCEVEGRSTIIYLIEEGKSVKEGDLLVELASDQIDDRIRQEELKEANAITAYEAAKTELEIQRDKNASDIRKAELEIVLKQLALEKYEKGDWVQRLKDAEIEIQQAKILLERSEEDYEANKKLFDKGYITRTKFEEGEFNYKKAQWDLEKALRAKDVLEAYTHRADLQQRQSDLDEAQKEAERVKKNAAAQELRKQRDLEGKEKELELIQQQLADLRTQREKCRIYAPTQGFVVYYTGGGGRHFRFNDAQIKEGAEVHERQILMQLPNTSEMIVDLRIQEAVIDKLRVGLPALIQIEGLPGRQFTGAVSKIAQVADSQSFWLNPDLKEYETKIRLDNAEADLKPGATAHVQILVDEVEDKLAVPVQAIYARGRKNYVFRQQGGDIEPVEVKLGLTSTEWAQVTDGLSAGESVLLAFTEQHTREVPEPLASEAPEQQFRRAEAATTSPGEQKPKTRVRGDRGGERAAQPGKQRPHRGQRRVIRRSKQSQP